MFVNVDMAMGAGNVQNAKYWDIANRRRKQIKTSHMLQLNIGLVHEPTGLIYSEKQNSETVEPSNIKTV